jgi:hypothetical protein
VQVADLELKCRAVRANSLSGVIGSHLDAKQRHAGATVPNPALENDPRDPNRDPNAGKVLNHSFHDVGIRCSQLCLPSPHDAPALMCHAAMLAPMPSLGDHVMPVNR